MKHDDMLVVFNALKEDNSIGDVIKFDKNIDMETPQNLRDWKLVYMAYVHLVEPVVEDVRLFYKGERYELDDDGEFIKYQEEK